MKLPQFLALGAVLLSQVLPTLAADPATPPTDPAKFEIYLLVGQSNMAGRGKPTSEDKRPVDDVLVLDKENQWVSQGEPIHFDKGSAGVGPGFTFGKLMAKKKPGVTIGLVPCAVGGTPISRWQPDGDLFKAAVARVEIAMKGGTLKGILWHQGESECGNEESAKAYGKNLTNVAEGFRTSLNSPDVPFIAGELGEYLYTRFPETKPYFPKIVNEEINDLPKYVKNSAVVPSKGLKDGGDKLHFDAESAREFGKRYFEAYQKLTGGK
jgi:hypothetical protein